MNFSSFPKKPKSVSLLVGKEYIQNGAAGSSNVPKLMAM